MKRIAAIIIFLFPLLASAQCPDQWMQNVEASKNLLAKAEEFLKIDLRERPHQTGTNYHWRDSLASSSFTVEDLADGRVRKIIISGIDENVKRLFNEFLKKMDCIESSGSNFIKTKDAEIVLQDGVYNRGQKKYFAGITIVRR